MAYTLPEMASSDPRIFDILSDFEIPSPEAAEAINKISPDNPTSQSSVRRWRSKHTKVEAEEIVSEQKIGAVGKGSVDVTSDGAQVNNVVVTSPILDDWGPIFSLFNLSADEFEVVDDTVRMSTWQQSARAKDGSRDSIQLYSYSARFKRKNKNSIRPEILREWRDALTRPKDIYVTNYITSPQEATYTIMIADPQLGKKGTEEAVDNWTSKLMAHLSIAGKLAVDGFIDSVHLAFMGDEVEGSQNNYANQTHTIELNRSQQLELDYDMSVWSVKQCLGLGLPLSVSSVISNHGEWTRDSTSHDPLTTRSDNSSTYVRRQVKKLFDELEPFTNQHIEWTIGDKGDPGVIVNISGVPTYFSHGYVEKGRGATTELKIKSAIENQILGDPLGFGEIPLWFMAHYHHYYQWEDRGRAIFGCPALEAEKSSEWLLQSSGVWSPPGMLGLVINPNISRKWEHLNVL